MAESLPVGVAHSSGSWWPRRTGEVPFDATLSNGWLPGKGAVAGDLQHAAVREGDSPKSAARAGHDSGRQPGGRIRGEQFGGGQRVPDPVPDAFTSADGTA